MLKNILIITAIIVTVIALGATATYITLRQGGEEVKEQPVATVPEAPEKPPVQPPETPSIPEPKPTTQPEQPTKKEERTNIFSPAKGEKWKIGKTYQIRWRPNNPKGFVTIRLYKLPIRSLNLVFETSVPEPNTGVYSFTVYPGMKPGTYKFLIIPDGNHVAKKGYSEVFSIVK